LRNAQEELREEHVEIALYNRLEAFANEVGDRETAQLAKAIRRDEERMAKFLAAELTRLVKDVVKAEIPRDQRPTTRTRARRARRSASSRRSGRSARSGSSTRSQARSSASGRSSASSRSRRRSGSSARSGGSASRSGS
jgi:hypothetical protein